MTEPFPAWALPRSPNLSGEGVYGSPWMDLSIPNLTVPELVAVAQHLRDKGSEALRTRSAEKMTRILGRVGRRFLDPGDPLRQRALEYLPLNSGLSPRMAEEVLDGMALDWTPERLEMLLRMEFPDPDVLEGFKNGSGPRHARALGPNLITHIGAGNVPGVSVGSMVRSLLVKAPLLMKPGRTDVVLPVLFAQGLAEVAPDLVDAVAVAYWPPDQDALTDAAIQNADLVVVYGGDEVVGEIRARTPATVRFVAYHHRVSAGLVGRGGLTDAKADRLADAAARAVSVFDQRGCVSPHVIYVEEGGAVPPREWAERLAGRLEFWAGRLPPGLMEPGEASAVQQLRGEMEMRIAAGEDLGLWAGDDLGWTVVLDPDPGFRASCLGRVVRVRPVPTLLQAIEEMTEVESHLQTVALGGVENSERVGIAEKLAQVGASRVTTFTDAPWPPPWWHHDGTGPLSVLVRWTDLER